MTTVNNSNMYLFPLSSVVCRLSSVVCRLSSVLCPLSAVVQTQASVVSLTLISRSVRKGRKDSFK